MRVGIGRRAVVAAGATVASGVLARKPLAAGAVSSGLGDLSRLKPGSGLVPPAFEFRLPDGTVRTLADYSGRGVVLNLWATWCVPCVAEMPALDALAALVAPGIAVLALSSDRGGAAAVERFFTRVGVKHLGIVLDPGGAGARALGARGIPTTVLIDAAGVERGRLEGTADWAGREAVAAVRALAR